MLCPEFLLTGKIEVGLTERLLHGNIIHFQNKELGRYLEKYTVPHVVVQARYQSRHSSGTVT